MALSEVAPVAVELHSRPILEGILPDYTRPMHVILAAMTDPAALEASRALAAAYDAACHALLSPSDYQEAEAGKRFKKRSGVRKLAMRFNVSTWPVHVEKGWLEDPVHGRIYYAEVHIQAVAPWGATTVGIGACTTRELRFCAAYPACPNCGGAMWDNRDEPRGREHFRCKNKKQCPGALRENEYDAAAVGRPVANARAVAKAEHDVLATAETRARNRATLDALGVGEVSAEEVDADAMRQDGEKREGGAGERGGGQGSRSRSSEGSNRGEGGKSDSRASQGETPEEFRVRVVERLEKRLGEVEALSEPAGRHWRGKVAPALARTNPPASTADLEKLGREMHGALQELKRKAAADPSQA